jgi:pimeloyl-ACP methyl ester carboxylesterase
VWEYFGADMEMWINTDDGRLYARHWPGSMTGTEQPPIVLLHDSLGCVELWRDFPVRLARVTGRAVIAYDRLGFGKSDPHPSRLGVDFVRQEARGGFSALIRQLGVERFIVFGHSIGGGMALSIGAAYPDRCCSVITESAQAFVEDRTLEGIKEAKKQFAIPNQIDRLKKYHGDKAQWVLDAWVNTWLSAEFALWSLDEDLAFVRGPVLAIHGEQDEYGTTRHPERIISLAAGSATFVKLPDCGHVPHREEEHTVLNAVRAFLGALDS